MNKLFLNSVWNGAVSPYAGSNQSLPSACGAVSPTPHYRLLMKETISVN